MKTKYYAFLIVWILLVIAFTFAFILAFRSIWSGGMNPTIMEVLPGSLLLGTIVACCISSPILRAGD